MTEISFVTPEFIPVTFNFTSCAVLTYFDTNVIAFPVNVCGPPFGFPIAGGFGFLI